MEWEVEFTDDFSPWWDGLTEVEQVDVNAKVSLLSSSEHERTSGTAFGKAVSRALCF
jgi:hypothetical protein